MKVLHWNIRGLGLPEKRRYLREFILKEHFDIICIQETKKEEFSTRFLHSISPVFSDWKHIPSLGVAGGILLGINSHNCQLIDWTIGKFSLTAYLQNTSDKVIWACTTVYGPTDQNLKGEFWSELSAIGSSWSGPLIIGGDFNAIRSRHEKKGVSFDLRNSEAFNTWINSLALIDLKCTDRNFTWARGGKSSQMACLDRILVNQAWLTLYPNTHTFSFSRTMSDHSPICLINGESSTLTTSQFRFEAYWLNQDGFFELMFKWWSSSPPGPISAQVWK
jgi:exonuclease III